MVPNTSKCPGDALSSRPASVHGHDAPDVTWPEPAAGCGGWAGITMAGPAVFRCWAAGARWPSAWWAERHADQRRAGNAGCARPARSAG